MGVTALFNERCNDLVDCIGGDGKANAGAGTAGADNGRIYTYYLTVHVEQRSAGVSRVYWSIGLNSFTDKTAVGAFDHSAQSGDHTEGKGALKTKGITEGYYKLSDLQLIGVTHRKWIRQMITFKFQHRQVGQRVGTDNFRLIHLIFTQ